MMETNCPHCDSESFAYKHILHESEHFHILCDVHPIVEGHLLIIPKEHISCTGELAPQKFQEFVELYEQSRHFIQETYGHVSTFEHGKIGQTVFHAHVHIFPFEGKPEQIVPEGSSYFYPLTGIHELPEIFSRDGQYLFFSIGNRPWAVDTSLGAPRFFRDRFAAALGSPERGNWKTMRKNAMLMAKAEEEISRTKERWRKREKV